MLTCYRTRRRLGAWLDGGLDEAEARAAGVHVDGCARCRSEVESLRRLRALLVAGFRAPAPADWTGFWPAVVRGIQDARPAAKPPGRRWRPRLAVGGALAAAALAALVIWPLTHETTKPDNVVVSLAEAGSSDGTVMVYSPPEHDLAVVWVFDEQQ